MAYRLNNLRNQHANQGSKFNSAVIRNNLAQQQQIAQQIDKIEAEMAVLSEFLATEMKDVNNNNKMMELLPIKKGSITEYVYYKNRNAGDRWRKVSVKNLAPNPPRKPGEPAVNQKKALDNYGKKGIFRHNKIDRQAIKEMLPELNKTKEIKLSSIEKELISSTLYGWADDCKKIGPFIRTGEAQMLRFSMGVGADLGYDAKNGLFKAGGRATASAALFSGYSQYAFY